MDLHQRGALFSYRYAVVVDGGKAGLGFSVFGVVTLEWWPMLKILMWGIGIYIIASYLWGGYVAWRLHRLRQKMAEVGPVAESASDVATHQAATDVHDAQQDGIETTSTGAAEDEKKDLDEDEPTREAA